VTHIIKKEFSGATRHMCTKTNEQTIKKNPHKQTNKQTNNKQNKIFRQICSSIRTYFVFILFYFFKHSEIRRLCFSTATKINPGLFSM